jgi:hypothetical protein
MKPEELATAIRDLTSWAMAHAEDPEPTIRVRLREHLGTDPAVLPVVSEHVTSYDHPNVQVALDAYLATGDASAEVIGLSLDRGFRAGLAEIAQSASRYGHALEPGPPAYISTDVGERQIDVLRAGLVLISEGEQRIAVLFGNGGEDDGEGGFALEAMAPDRATATAWLRRLRALMREHNVYRGKVLVFGSDEFWRPAPLSVRRLPSVPRDRIVLPADALDRIERHTAGLARHRDRLRAAGRHIKRGLLLHGPPGTGKTLTVMYLAGLMPERTVVLLTGQHLGAIGPAVRLARSLEPAMVVLEDVDLVAMDREYESTNPLLFELLNAMDGLDEDADLIFVLTTNRADLLEPALASRPGRIDLAVELPLPGPADRERLLALYGEGLDAELGDPAAIVAATDGTSPAFIRELMRRAAHSAAESDERVRESHLLAAAQDLLRSGDSITANLLGADRKRHGGGNGGGPQRS